MHVAHLARRVPVPQPDNEAVALGTFELLKVHVLWQREGPRPPDRLPRLGRQCIPMAHLDPLQWELRGTRPVIIIIMVIIIITASVY